MRTRATDRARRIPPGGQQGDRKRSSCDMTSCSRPAAGKCRSSRWHNRLASPVSCLLTGWLPVPTGRRLTGAQPVTDRLAIGGPTGARRRGSLLPDRCLPVARACLASPSAPPHVARALAPVADHRSTRGRASWSSRPSVAHRRHPARGDVGRSVVPAGMDGTKPERRAARDLSRPSVEAVLVTHAFCSGPDLVMVTTGPAPPWA